MPEQEVIVKLLDHDVTLYDILVEDDPDNIGGGIISCDWKCDDDVDKKIMIEEIRKFILSVIEHAVEKDKNDEYD